MYIGLTFQTTSILSKMDLLYSPHHVCIWIFLDAKTSRASSLLATGCLPRRRAQTLNNSYHLMKASSPSLSFSGRNTFHTCSLIRKAGDFPLFDRHHITTVMCRHRTSQERTFAARSTNTCLLIALTKPFFPT